MALPCGVLWRLQIITVTEERHNDGLRLSPRAESEQSVRCMITREDFAPTCNGFRPPWPDPRWVCRGPRLPRPRNQDRYALASTSSIADVLEADQAHLETLLDGRSSRFLNVLPAG